MAPDRDDEPVGGPEAEDWEESPRSIFSTTWFRAVIVVLVVGAVAAVSIPYVMDAVSPPRPTPAPARVATPPTPPPAPAAPAPPTASAPAPTPSPPAPKSSPVASAVTKPAEIPQPVAKSEAPKPVTPNVDSARAPAPKTDAKAEPARSAAPKAAKQVAQAPKAEPQPAAKADAPPPRAARATAPAAERGDVWVQVGAFRDAETAKRVADGLRGKGFQVAESTTTTTPAAGAATTAAPDAGDRYDVIVAGGAPGDVAKKLTAKGLSAEERRDGAVVRPSLPLRDAVTLSNDLRGEGLTVTVRRAVAPGAAALATPAAAGGPTLHRVRVGAFADRASARAALEKLQALGYTPFIAKGRE